MLWGAGPLRHTAEKGCQAHWITHTHTHTWASCATWRSAIGVRQVVLAFSGRPPWVDTMFESRPWVSLQAICRAPCDARKPELVFNLSPGRDVAGSTCLLCRLGYSEHEGSLRNLAACLKNARKSFKPCCFCLKPVCWPRYFSPSFFNVKLLTDFAWSNSPKKHIIVLLV